MFPAKKKPEPEPTPEPESPVEPRMNKVERWRFDRLVAAGYTETQSLWIALDRRIDLHEAVALRGQTELAFQILN